MHKNPIQIQYVSEDAGDSDVCDRTKLLHQLREVVVLVNIPVMKSIKASDGNITERGTSSLALPRVPYACFAQGGVVTCWCVR